MKKINIFCAIFLTVVVLCSGCRSDQILSPSQASNAENSAVSSSSETKTAALLTDDDMFTKRDGESQWDLANSISIQLNQTNVACNANGVMVDGTTVTITKEGTYVLSGSLQDGTIVVDAGEQDKLQLVLNNASVASNQSAALYVRNADKVFVTLADGTVNTLSNGGTFVSVDDNQIDGAVFSKQDLTFNGNGKLTVTSPTGHGIVCKDDVVFMSGTYTVDAALHGVDANNSVRVKDGAFAITSGKDGVHAEHSEDTSLGYVYVAGGKFTATTDGDGVSASAHMQINNGEFQLLCGGGNQNGETHQSTEQFGHGGMMHPDGMAGVTENTVNATQEDVSAKGLKAGGELYVADGRFTIDSADDGVHSNASVTVKNGKFTVMSGDDGFHSDETLTVHNGTIAVTESYEGFEGLHINLLGGDITLTSSDDGLNAAGGTDQSGFGGPHGGGDRFGGGMPPQGGGHMGGQASSDGSISISGGNLTVHASGDGIDANGTLEISGGNVAVHGPTMGDTAVLDYDLSATISGGTFVGTGAMQMAQTFSDSTQGVLSISVGNQPAGTSVTVQQADGATLYSCEPPLDFAILIVSTPQLVKGETYTITVGSQSASFAAE